MPFVANTPESLLDRSDSKNPASTCRGLTSNGRLCRRSISATPTPNTSPARKKSHSPPFGRAQTLTTTTTTPQNLDLGDERLYCWQHKDQAIAAARPTHSSSTLSAASQRKKGAATTVILEEERTSIDTLVDRLGLVELHHHHHKKPALSQPPAGPKHAPRSSHRRQPQSHSQRQPSRGTLHLCFCFTVPLEEEPRRPLQASARPQPRPVQRPAPSSTVPATQMTQHPRPHHHLPAPPAQPASKASSNGNSPSKASVKSTASQTARFKRLIPDSLDTVTASALMAELSRPYVDSDEPGYIYMFWLTPCPPASSVHSPSAARSGAPVDAARSLLSPPSTTNIPGGGRSAPRFDEKRASDLVTNFSHLASSTPQRKTMMLKIGRAANVQRRMNQWQRQCGRDVEVLRYYPYNPSSSSSPLRPSPNHSSSSTSFFANPQTAPRPTPHCKRVERLIHLELAGMGLAAQKKGPCEACGREHREWFEVEASRKAVGVVDAVIRRWVDWDDGIR